jgi:hypothetical protein
LQLTSGAFIAARNTEIRDLMLRMKHDLNRQFYADGIGAYESMADDDYEEYEDD